MIYHITQAEHWRAADEAGVYRPPGFAADGFIHCCTAEQIAEVANRYFRGEADLRGAVPSIHRRWRLRYAGRI